MQENLQEPGIRRTGGIIEGGGDLFNRIREPSDIEGGIKRDTAHTAGLGKNSIHTSINTTVRDILRKLKNEGALTLRVFPLSVRSRKRLYILIGINT